MIGSYSDFVAVPAPIHNRQVYVKTPTRALHSIIPWWNFGMLRIRDEPALRCRKMNVIESLKEKVCLSQAL